MGAIEVWKSNESLGKKYDRFYLMHLTWFESELFSLMKNCLVNAFSNAHKLLECRPPISKWLNLLLLVHLTMPTVCWIGEIRCNFCRFLKYFSKQEDFIWNCTFLVETLPLCACLLPGQKHWHCDWIFSCDATCNDVIMILIISKLLTSFPPLAFWITSRMYYFQLGDSYRLLKIQKRLL